MLLRPYAGREGKGARASGVAEGLISPVNGSRGAVVMLEEASAAGTAVAPVPGP